MEKKINLEKNSPTGIRTPVFHVTGEDTNQLYYWRSLNKSKRKKDKRKKNKKKKIVRVINKKKKKTKTP